MTLLFLVNFILLGCWQVQRAHEKEKILSEFAQRSHSDAIGLDQIKSITPDMLYQPVRVTGEFDNQNQYLLDNQFYQHQFGYHVITPLVTKNRTVLIDRGWVAGDVTRRHLPSLLEVTGPVTVVGLIYWSNKATLTLSAREDHPGHWPEVIEKIDFEKVSQQRKNPIFPALILLNSGQPYGFVRAHSPVIMPPARHYAYAFQWFSFAVILVLIFLGLNSQKQESNRAN